MAAEDQIRQYAERIVRLEEERRALASDIKDTKAEAKSAGFSPKLIAKCVAIMLMEAEKRAAALGDHEELDLYLGAVGLIAQRSAEPVERVPRESASAMERGQVTAGAAGTLPSDDANPVGSVERHRSQNERAPVRPGEVSHGVAGRREITGVTAGERPGTLLRESASDLDPSELFGEPRSRIHPLPATGREEGRHLHSDRSS
jgi:uncharacterized protein (UPF0335 family)